MNNNLKANKASEVETKIAKHKKRKLRIHDQVEEEKPLSPSSEELKIEESDILFEEGNKKILATEKARKSKSSKIEETDVPPEQGNKTKLHKEKTRKSKSSTGTEDSTLTLNKKIKFGTDDLGEVKKRKKKPKQDNHFNDEDAEVKDEDIDKFCEELDEEDNKEYENWVKLFEANFRSDKKKT